MLDAWPAPGSTTTLDALSNGVPVLTKLTPGGCGHYVRTIVEACGLPELIAASAEDFVARATDLASDYRRLDALRSRVRPGFDCGACSDEAGFTRRAETAFGEMFDLWFSRGLGRRAYG
jgi:protein O-GlcNAc transferase